MKLLIIQNFYISIIEITLSTLPVTQYPIPNTHYTILIIQKRNKISADLSPATARTSYSAGQSS